ASPKAFRRRFRRNGVSYGRRVALLQAHGYTLRHVESRTGEGFEKLRSWKSRTSQGVLTLGSPRRDNRQSLIRSRNRILVVPLGPLCGPHDRLDINVLIYAEDHALVDFGHRGQENAAIAFHLGSHFGGWLIELANPLHRRRVVDPGSGAVVTFRDLCAAFIKPVSEVVVAAFHPIVVAASATRPAQALIGDGADSTGTGQVGIRFVGYVLLNSRIANDLSERIDATLSPGAEYRICLKSVGQTPDHFLC